MLGSRHGKEFWRGQDAPLSIVGFALLERMSHDVPHYREGENPAEVPVPVYHQSHRKRCPVGSKPTEPHRPLRKRSRSCKFQLHPSHRKRTIMGACLLLTGPALSRSWSGTGLVFTWNMTVSQSYVESGGSTSGPLVLGLRRRLRRIWQSTRRGRHGGARAVPIRQAKTFVEKSSSSYHTVN